MIREAHIIEMYKKAPQETVALTRNLKLCCLRLVENHLQKHDSKTQKQKHDMRSTYN